MMIRHRICLSTIVLVCCLSTLGCSQSDGDVAETGGTEATLKPKARDNRPSSPTNTVPRQDGPSEDDYPALQNLLQVSRRIFSGGEPNGDEAFASLARLGVRTVVSVDGVKPDVEATRKHGLRYVHIPIGYDGVEKKAGLSLARLVRDADGPFF